MVELDALAVRLGTGALTHVHHVQEVVNFPNLFLPDPVHLTCNLPENKKIVVKTKVYRKMIPLIFFLGEDRDSQILTIHLMDFPLLYSGDREVIYRRDPFRQEALEQLLAIRTEFLDSGSLRMGDFGRCCCEVLSLKAYVDYAVREEKRLITQFEHLYDLTRLQTILDEGRCPP